MHTALLLNLTSYQIGELERGERSFLCKSEPRLRCPFKCYMYNSALGRVVGEFICTKTERTLIFPSFFKIPKTMDNVGHIWYIGKVKIYSQAKSLDCFKLPSDDLDSMKDWVYILIEELKE